MHTWQVNRIAVGTSTKAVCEALRKFGKVCSTRWVNLQCEEPTDVRRTNYYEAFVLWFTAIFVVNRAGAEFLFEDFRARVAALCELEDLATGDWRTQIARCEGEHSDIIRVAFLNGTAADLKREIAEDIAEKRRLLAIIAAQEAREAAARAA